MKVDGMNVVFVELDRCMGCLSCERACQFQQADQSVGWRPNIFVRVDMERRRIFAGTCLQCETALCMEVCPISAITRDPKTSAVIVSNETCLGCGMCVAACPFGYMQLDDTRGKAAKCDLCKGKPKCVEVCMAKALHFDNLNTLAERKRRQVGIRLGLRAVPSDQGDDK